MASAELLDEKQSPRDPQRMLLRGMDWETYCKLRNVLQECRVRLTYDRGNLELMTLALAHERYGSLLGRMLETLTMELDLPLQSGVYDPGPRRPASRSGSQSLLLFGARVARAE